MPICAHSRLADIPLAFDEDCTNRYSPLPNAPGGRLQEVERVTDTVMSEFGKAVSHT